MINNLATSVIQSLNSPGPIEVIRLFGHTDSTGNEKHNLGLGDRRARAVAAALQDKLKGFLGRVKIVVEPSPGETDPRADNRTGEGRARNRRVEVFITTGVTIPPIKKRVVLTVPKLRPGAIIETIPDPILTPKYLRHLHHGLYKIGSTRSFAVLCRHGYVGESEMQS